MLFVVNNSVMEKEIITLNFSEKNGKDIYQRVQTFPVAGNSVELTLEAGAGVLVALRYWSGHSHYIKALPAELRVVIFGEKWGNFFKKAQNSVISGVKRLKKGHVWSVWFSSDSVTRVFESLRPSQIVIIRTSSYFVRRSDYLFIWRNLIIFCVDIDYAIWYNLGNK